MILELLSFVGGRRLGIAVIVVGAVVKAVAGAMFVVYRLHLVVWLKFDYKSLAEIALNTKLSNL